MHGESRSAVMKANWLFDARKIPDDVMSYLRRIAVRAVEEKSYSPELIADIFGISRSSVYDWLRRYRKKGENALDTQPAPGAPRVITPNMDQWLRETIMESTPGDYGYDAKTEWTHSLLADLLKKQFGVEVAGSTVGLHLRNMDLNGHIHNHQIK
ncbi:MAG: hypothetical protein QG599_127 [Pseudomonadota bacterium]|nr:hypothetical protein [Pseudomonadota bacterium]